MRLRILIVTCALLLCSAAAQDQTKHSDDMANMPGMNHDTSAMHDEAGSDHAMHAMQSHHMDMGPHMKMTALRNPQPGDQEQAAAIVADARKAVEKYQDYHVALNDGFKIFLPNVTQKMYHFTSRRNAFEAAFHFDPEKPTSLLYEKEGENYKLIGLMYTAPRTLNEDQLNKRVPLSVAQWHEHVNLCLPPKDQQSQFGGDHPRFGLRGSIATESECKDAGGRWIPQVFGWMLHMYPFEQNTADIWSLERQHAAMAGHDHID